MYVMFVFSAEYTGQDRIIGSFLTDEWVNLLEVN